ncbi:MAG TPA: DNA polymerase Y family protein [Gammaproteobacteria bacterium]|nr:DNA polymerase Y family protein [Gammaproteobacteria bacterium]
MLFCNTRAQQCGVRPGMPVAAARALVHELIVHAVDRKAGQDALRSLADWAYQFSSQVSLYPPYALLLEVQGSFTLFGGQAALLKNLHSGLTALGYKTRLAGAPTPLAAFSLARFGSEQMVTAPHQLAAVLAPLPISVLDWEQTLLDRLDGMGVRRLGDVLRVCHATDWRGGWVNKACCIWTACWVAARIRKSCISLPGCSNATCSWLQKSNRPRHYCLSCNGWYWSYVAGYRGRALVCSHSLCVCCIANNTTPSCVSGCTGKVATRSRSSGIGSTVISVGAMPNKRVATSRFWRALRNTWDMRR